MANKCLVCVGIILLFNLFGLSSSKYVEGTLNTASSRSDWEFLARFCFLSDRGRLQFEFTYPRVSYEPQNILLYFDEEDQWDAVYKTDKTCVEKMMSLSYLRGQIIPLDVDIRTSGCYINKTTHFTTCKSERLFRSARDRWWYIATSNCGIHQGLNLDYKLWMTNGEADDLFFRHFSADEFYILQVDISFLLIFSFMFCISIVCGVVLRNRQLFHTTYKMFMVSLACEVVYLFLMCIALGKYANDGIENPGLKLIARIFESISTLVFLLLLILMGKGYTITRGRLSSSGSIKIAVFMTLYTIAYAVLFIYEAEFFDPGEVLYLYESPGGYGLIGLRLISWVWFCYAIFFTLKHYPEKSSFYYPFFIFYTIWFWAGPITVFVASIHIEAWAREKIVNGIDLTVTFTAQAVFLFLTRPTAANKNFPYHVRTTQIGIMQTQSSGGADNFGQRPYAPSDEPPPYNDGPQFHELFTVSNPRAAEAKMPPSDDLANYGAAAPPINGNLDSFPHSRPTQPQVPNNPFVTSHTTSKS